MKNNIIKPILLTAVMMLMITSTFAQTLQEPKISKSVYFGKSKPLREIKMQMPGHENLPQKEMRNEFSDNNVAPVTCVVTALDVPMQNYHGLKKSSSPLLNYEGVGNVNNVAPADPNGDVGMNHFIQTVNVSFAVWDKEANLIFGPVTNKSIWDVFPGPWNNVDWYQDPIFKYDKQADRWVVSAMVLDFEQDQFYEMLAVSASCDPLGEYYCYAFEFENVNDYPKIAIWNDGYYLTHWMNTSAGQYLYTTAAVVDREAMLAGEPMAAMIEFVIEEPNAYTYRESAMAADFKGSLLPEEMPCYFVVAEYIQIGYPWAVNLDVYEFATDWANPENSSFEMVNQLEVEPVVPFNYIFPAAPQPGNFHDVETINFVLMYPITYRKFETYEMMTCCQTLWTGEIHCIRWFELRKDSVDWYIYQSGNYSPDNASRYMPSISVNVFGDIALGYTKSSLEINPSIWITGKQATDTLGVMSYQEVEIMQGLSYANNVDGTRNRWGDYSCMMVDPADDRTFWYTSMYTIDNTEYGNWSTRITKFKLDELTDSELWPEVEPRLYVYPNPSCGISDIRYQLLVGSRQSAVR